MQSTNNHIHSDHPAALKIARQPTLCS